MDCIIVFFGPTNLYGIILNKRGYVRDPEVAPHAQEQHHDPHEVGGLKFGIFCHANTFCEISNDLHGLMSLNGHSGAPDCTLIPSQSKMDPTIVFFRS